VKSMGDSDKERFMALLFKAVRKLSWYGRYAWSF
jgi:hypothetical protein